MPATFKSMCFKGADSLIKRKHMQSTLDSQHATQANRHAYTGRACTCDNVIFTLQGCEQTRKPPSHVCKHQSVSKRNTGHLNQAACHLPTALTRAKDQPQNGMHACSMFSAQQPLCKQQEANLQPKPRSQHAGSRTQDCPSKLKLPDIKALHSYLKASSGPDTT